MSSQREGDDYEKVCDSENSSLQRRLLMWVPGKTLNYLNIFKIRNQFNSVLSHVVFIVLFQIYNSFFLTIKRSTNEKNCHNHNINSYNFSVHDP